MRTKEQLYHLIDCINPNDWNIVMQILERFAWTSDVPNEETMTAMMEADAIAHDPKVKGYENLSDLMEALDEE